MNSADQKVKSYLKDLDQRLSYLPRRRRKEVLQEIGDHIAESRTELGPDHPVDDVLDRVGDPQVIAREAAGDEGFKTSTSRWVEILAIIFLVPGSVLLPFVGWVIGVILLWASSVWTVRDKIIGTLIVPGGLLAPVVIAMSTACSTVAVDGHVVSSDCPQGFAATAYLVGWILLTVAPIGTAMYLGLRVRRASVPR
jgi:uncharacterized membrane protein